MHYTTIDPQKKKNRTQQYTTIDDPRKDKHDKDSNPLPCATPLMTPEKTNIRAHDMRYTTIDSRKVKDSNP
jgi:hypothetical protein